MLEAGDFAALQVTTMNMPLFKILAAGLVWCISSSLVAADVDEAFFETQIRPVLIQRCFECHGQNDPKGAFRVDSREALVKGGDSGAAIVPGNADASLLVRAIRHTDQDLQMPPKSPLSKEVVTDFARWVNSGAPWPAFKSIRTRRIVAVNQFSARVPNDASLKAAMQLWLKADGGPWQDGQAVYLWEDASGRGHDLAATAGARSGGTGGPGHFVARSMIAGYPAVHFDTETGLGGNAVTAPDISGDAEFTLIFVLRATVDPKRQADFFAGLGDPAGPVNPGRARGACIEFPLGSAGRPSFVGGWGNDARAVNVPTTSPLDGSPLIVALTKQRGPVASTASFSLNGIPSGPLEGHAEVPEFTRRSDLGFFIGRVQPWARGFSGDIAEVLLYNRSLSVEERSGVEAHLSAKYRIPLASTQQEQVVEGGDPHFSPSHWAYEPLKKVSPPGEVFAENPTEKHSRLIGIGESEFRHPIDQFAAEKWVSQKLKPVELANARTLVRRLYYDLIGLPPSVSQMEEGVASLTPWNDAAWASLIDRLLESPHYGERWGRHWLDVVRYADTAGDNADYPVPEARYYRDYVIDSFNADKPYDQFVREQLAGDILAAEGPREKYAEQISATGFLALSRRYATAPYELWHLTLEDTIDTVGQTFMGVTLRCARCHDHKFDPVTQREYYALYGIFESTQFPWAGGEEFQSQKFPRQHFVPLIPPDEVAPYLKTQADLEQQLISQVAEFERESPLVKSMAVLTEKLTALKSASASTTEIAAVQGEYDKIKKQLEAKKTEILTPKEAARRRGFPDTVPVAYAVSEGLTRSTYLQRSGDPGQSGPVIARGVPSFLPTAERIDVPANASGRRQLADWLTRPDHPLTGRVFVNRIWQHHFGRGLVATPSNFGVRGVPPTHPELLDWLTHRFVENGWSTKAIHRLILTSHVWRLSSSHDERNAARDPDNAYLWQHDRTRLEAESIRDSMLAASGQLDLTRPGEHPFPSILKWNYTQHSQFKDFYPSQHRSIYLMTSRLQRHPYLALFDSPDTNTTTGLRTSSIVSAQALYLMNSPDIKSLAEVFAKVALRQPADSRIAAVYRLAYQRLPSAEENSQVTEFLAAYARQADESAAWTALCRSLLTSHEFFYVD
jgi:hypothetical protein